ncbi:MAG: hypothetical protein CSA19_01150 [Deltaproteobacteria bacterium]|nr:MAG: hypothetical protein CSA19_01150 [Deltaproteobacteria bacterium]
MSFTDEILRDGVEDIILVGTQAQRLGELMRANRKVALQGLTNSYCPTRFYAKDGVIIMRATGLVVDMRKDER